MFVLVYTQISPAISRARRTMSAGASDVAETSARAAASAYAPPDPIASVVAVELEGPPAAK